MPTDQERIEDLEKQVAVLFGLVGQLQTSVRAFSESYRRKEAGPPRPDESIRDYHYRTRTGEYGPGGIWGGGPGMPYGT
jgi:hypothetical protein